MYKTFIRENELSDRICFDDRLKAQPIVSSVWIESLYKALLDAGHDVVLLRDAFRNAVEGFLSDRRVFTFRKGDLERSDSFRGEIGLDRLRMELSRVPLLFRIKVEYPRSQYDRTMSAKVILAECEGKRLPVGSPECPSDVFFPLSKSDLERQAGGVWLFYPPDLAQSLGFAMRSVWSEEDSLVDWIMEFVENERYSKSPRIIRHESPVGWSFYRPSVDGILLQVVQPIPSDISKAAAPRTETETSDIEKAAAAELKEVAAEAELSEMNVNSKAAAALTETAEVDIDKAAAREVHQEQEVVKIKAAAEAAAEFCDKVAAVAELSEMDADSKAAAARTEMEEVDIEKAAAVELPQEQETEDIKVAARKPVDVNTDVEKAAAAFDVGEENEVLASAAIEVDLSEWHVTATDREIAVRILEENFIASCDHRLGRTSVYETYIALVSAISPVRKPLSAGKFYKLVREVYPHVSDKTPRVNGKPVRSFIGIAYCDGSSEQK